MSCHYECWIQPERYLGPLLGIMEKVHGKLLARLRQYRIYRGEVESALSYHDFRTRMALQHAQGDRSGRLLAWLLQGEHRRAPAMLIRIADGTVATSQLAVDDAFRDYYRQLYEKPTHLGHELCAGFSERGIPS
ncbi:hypothetical protein NDU88_004285 [Pleurodeles waltl]|uniref:Uncharacterized protein n=1 Tax=Pleurodeles waltl TaxID=8319 RepID=A0AAV7SIE0_PLEWA|nr:hypothetical protein NDU88_004285 [Pleurodeles waltl]